MSSPLQTADRYAGPPIFNGWVRVVDPQFPRDYVWNRRECTLAVRPRHRGATDQAVVLIERSDTHKVLDIVFEGDAEVAWDYAMAIRAYREEHA